MQVLSSTAHHTGTDLRQRMPSVEAELAGLRAQVARLEAEKEALRWAANHDDLTGLPNRRLLTRLAPSMLDGPAVVFMLDLNGFKPVNDQFGHEAGDCVLRLIAQRLASSARDDLVARLGGDEFAGVLTKPQTFGRWWHPAIAKIAAAIAEPMLIGGRTFTVTASIGLAATHGQTPIGELLHRADLAMYQAKHQMRMMGDPLATVVCDPIAGTEIIHHDSRTLEGSTVVVLELSKPDGEGGAPAHEPHDRHPADVVPASSYRSGDPVWVYREGAWREGFVEAASARAVLARYRGKTGPGMLTDTVWAEYVHPRAAMSEG
jgi:diguanylate cyclase (GGDEF)-like protein